MLVFFLSRSVERLEAVKSGYDLLEKVHGSDCDPVGCYSNRLSIPGRDQAKVHE